eukprot:CAMPEP_0117443530 /NCGR_PEP_ID=MMETSP0759-20121206/4741_1 /TAXON_ID=63605 /ORGANISM="Percolomonas cosmopolitus, Strain WS" /LENGTH=801 /DNA_ID=CAMNT_0005235505 /DNA_START=203 /DNA_END=2609 /DNA_ORIENTATION=+
MSPSPSYNKRDLPKTVQQHPPQYTPAHHHSDSSSSSTYGYFPTIETGTSSENPLISNSSQLDENQLTPQQSYDKYHAQFEQRHRMDQMQQKRGAGTAAPPLPSSSSGHYHQQQLSNVSHPDASSKSLPNTQTSQYIPRTSDHIYKERDYSKNGASAKVFSDSGTQSGGGMATHQHSGQSEGSAEQKRSTPYSSFTNFFKTTLSSSGAPPSSDSLQKLNTHKKQSSGSTTTSASNNGNIITPGGGATPSTIGQAGLSNPKGSNNCFLNVVVQLLFHVPIFQSFFLSLHSQKHKCADRNSDGSLRDANTSRCVFCALQILFTHFRYGADETLTPIQLRESLSRAYEASGRFQLFQMDDACEAYQSLIEQLNDSMKHCGIRIACFDFQVNEQTVCPTCKSKGSVLKYTSNLWYINSDEFLKHKRKHPQLTFQKIFRRTYESERKTCDNPSCGPVPVYKTVEVPPVLCIGVAWDNQRKENITDFLQLIPEKTTVGELFRVSNIKECQARLRGVLLYYGKHYSCATLDDSSQNYFLFDDHNVRKVGTWNDLVKKCSDGHLLPLLFIFEVIDHPHAQFLRIKSNDAESLSPDDHSPITPLSSVTGSHLDESSLFPSVSPQKDMSNCLNSTEARNTQSTPPSSARRDPPFTHLNRGLTGGLTTNIGSPATPRGQKRNVSDFGILLIGSNLGVMNFVLDAGPEENLVRTIHLPHDYVHDQVQVCVFNQSRDMTGFEGRLILGLRSETGEIMWQQEQRNRISESFSSQLLSFPVCFVNIEASCFDLALCIRKKRKVEEFEEDGASARDDA